MVVLTELCVCHLAQRLHLIASGESLSIQKLSVGGGKMSKTALTNMAPAPTAADFMQKRVKTISPEESLVNVIAFLQKHRLSNAPVVEQEGRAHKLVGFLSERDCLAALAKEAFFGGTTGCATARTIMRTHPICVAPETELFTLASIFVNHGFRHLPVVEQDRLVGIVSRRDILQAMDAHYRRTIREHNQEYFPPDVHEIVNHRFVMQGR